MSIKYKFWFPHDTNPLNNRGLNSMFRKYKAQGYGMWWRLNEILSNQPEYKMDITNEEIYHELADDMRCDVETLLSFIDDCINKYSLLQKDDINIWSLMLLDTMQPLEEKRSFLSERGRKGAEAMHAKRKAKATEPDATSIEQAGENMAEESREEKSREEQKRVDDSREDKNLPTPPVAEAGITHPLQTQYQPFGSLEQLRDRALADEFHFTAIYIAQQQVKNLAELRNWLDAFHKWLRFCGEHVKNEKDYRTHFKNWFAKQDRSINPTRYDPVPRAVPIPAPKTLAQILAAQHKSDEEILKRIKNAS